jgi:hypothetical protein
MTHAADIKASQDGERRPSMSGVDLLGSELTSSEERLLGVYEELKALAADDSLPPNVTANVRAALALMHQVVNGMALTFEHLSDLGV